MGSPENNVVADALNLPWIMITSGNYF
jgi:hypothetical protein